MKPERVDLLGRLSEIADGVVNCPNEQAAKRFLDAREGRFQRLADDMAAQDDAIKAAKKDQRPRRKS